MTQNSLDEFQTSCEDLLEEARENQEKMSLEIETIREALKSKLLSALDLIFDGISDLAQKSSIFSKLRSALGHFDFDRSEFETRDCEWAQGRLAESIEGLLYFDRIARNFELENGCNIEDLLKRIQTRLEKAIAEFRASACEIRKQEISSLLESQEKKDDQFSLSLRCDLSVFRVGSSSLQNQDALTSFSKKLDRIRQRFLGKDETRPQTVELKWPRDGFFLFKDIPKTDYPEKCYLMNKGGKCLTVRKGPRGSQLYLRRLSYLFKKSSLERIRKVQKNSLEFGKKFEQSVNDLMEKIDAHRQKDRLAEFARVVHSLKVSPSDRFIAVRLKGRPMSEFYRITKANSRASLVKLNVVEKFHIDHFIFVDGPENELLVFVDRAHRLNVFNLETQKVEFSLENGPPILSVYYVDPLHVLFLTHEFRLALFTLDSQMLSAQVALEDNFSEEASHSDLGKKT